jgi:hypothetical protein
MEAITKNHRGFWRDSSLAIDYFVYLWLRPTDMPRKCTLTYPQRGERFFLQDFQNSKPIVATSDFELLKLALRLAISCRSIVKSGQIDLKHESPGGHYFDCSTFNLDYCFCIAGDYGACLQF